jgi:hypothetical protein
LTLPLPIDRPFKFQSKMAIVLDFSVAHRCSS